MTKARTLADYVPFDSTGLLTSDSALDATKLTGDLPALDGSALTGLDTGERLTHASWWYLTEDFSDSAVPITSNLSEGIAMGSPMIETSGVFTFPSTGIWHVHFHCGWFGSTDQAEWLNARIRHTADGQLSWQGIASGTSTIQKTSTGTQATVDTIINVTDVTNHKVAFASEVEEVTITTRGASGSPKHTYMTFIRLGDAVE